MTTSPRQSPRRPQQRHEPDGPVSRVLRVLRAVAEESTSINVSRMATRLGLPRSTAHRFLQALEGEGIITLTASGYVLGPEAFRLGSLLTGGFEIGHVAAPIIEELVSEVNETILLGVYLPASGAMMFADKVECTHAIKYTVEMHRPLSLVWGASGRVITAHLTADLRKSLLESEANAPGNGTNRPTLQQFEAQCTEIRDKGYAISFGEKSTGAVGIATAILGPGEAPLGSLCLTLPEYRFDPSRGSSLGALLAERAAHISVLLGGPGLAASARGTWNQVAERKAR